jgi:hypothetical protein
MMHLASTLAHLVEVKIFTELAKHGQKEPATNLARIRVLILDTILKEED